MNFLVHQLMANFGKAKTSLLLETTAIRGGSELPSFVRAETSQIICTHSRTNATASKVYTLFSCCIIRNVMWLAANQKPDFRTINAFRGERLKSVIEEVFTATVKLLYEKGYVKLEKYFVDGTKIESAANK